MPFVPGGRKAARSLEPFIDGVPDVLREPLLKWCSGHITSVHRLELIAMEFDILLPKVEYFMLTSFAESLCLQLAEDDDTFLELVEYLVERMTDDNSLRRLQAMLAASRSIYAVRRDPVRLAYRVDPTVQSQTEQAVDEADPGVAHWLTEAWNDAYDRSARPGPAYDAAIKAVEAAYRGIVIPKNARGTITQVINALRDGRTKFKLELEDSRGGAAGANEPVIDTVDTVLALLRTLAYGQKTRHGESGVVTINSVDEARTAVQIAVTLVQWANSGAFSVR